jgi:hypothetical protein
MAVQSENERNKAVVDEYFKAGVQGHLTSFAAYLHPDFTVTAPNYLPWGGRHVAAAFFRDHLLSSVTDVFDFARFSYDNVVAEMATSWRYSTSALPGPTRSLRSLTTGRSGTVRPSRSGPPISSRRPCSRNSGSSLRSMAE